MEEIINEEITPVTTLIDETATNEVISDVALLYDRNDLCLRITPFDNYKKIRIYSDNNSEMDVDRSGLYKYNLVFMDTKNTIKIGELEDKNYNDYMDTHANELVFKISKKDAAAIYKLRTNDFYIVRDTVVNNTIIDTQSMFYGRWATDADWKVNNTTKQMNELKNMASSLAAENRDLQIESLKMANRIIELEKEVAELKQYESYKEMYELLVDANATAEHEAVNIEKAVKYVNYNINMTEEEQANAIKNLLDDTMM